MDFFRVLPLPASTPTLSFLFLPTTLGKSGNWFCSFDIRDGLGFDSCGLKKQALCGSATEHLWRHLSPWVCSETSSGRFSIEAAQVVHHRRAPVQSKGALAMADELSLRVHDSWLLETIPASWRDLGAGVIFLRHVFLFGEALFACKGHEREQEAGVLLGADLKII